jgi:hypothetical protein
VKKLLVVRASGALELWLLKRKIVEDSVLFETRA